MSRFKILVFLLTLGIAGTIVAAAYWYYKNVLGHDQALATEIKAMQGNKASLPDPGIRRFERAVELIEKGEVVEGRNALYDLLRTFPNSNRATEAKRIIGEINMDMMFSVETNPQKKKYIVQTGDSVGLIARKQETTVECLMRANGLFHHRLHPGDHLYVFPLDFDIVVDVSAKTLTLLRNYGPDGKNKLVFKEYPLVDVRLPTFVKPPVEWVISSRAAYSSGKPVDFTNPLFFSADKWLIGNKPKSTSGGVNIRAVPQAKPVVVAPETADAKDKGVQALDSAPEPGIFMQREDVEELYTIIRAGTLFSIVR